MSAYRPYNAEHSGPAYSKRYRAPARLKPFSYKVKGGQKVTALYTDLANAWRAGAIRDFYYGTRSETDDTLVWKVEGVEWSMAQTRGVLDGALLMAGIESIEIGPTWCGYPTMTVRYADGSVLVDSYDGCARVETLNGRRSTVAVAKELFPELGELATF